MSLVVFLLSTTAHALEGMTKSVLAHAEQPHTTWELALIALALLAGTTLVGTGVAGRFSEEPDDEWSVLPVVGGVALLIGGVVAYQVV